MRLRAFCVVSPTGVEELLLELEDGPSAMISPKITMHQTITIKRRNIGTIHANYMATPRQENQEKSSRPGSHAKPHQMQFPHAILVSQAICSQIWGSE